MKSKEICCDANENRVCIVGGGPSAMVAAITAKRLNPSLDIIIMEKMDRLGKKLLATGNGRCNLSNESCAKVGETLSFFQSLGVFTRTDEEGRIYPYNESSYTVADALQSEIDELDIRVMTNKKVSNVAKSSMGFCVDGVECRKLLIACGGKAGSHYGTTGDGYGWAKAFGHKVEKPIPVLTAVELCNPSEQLAGVRANAMIRLTYDHRNVFHEEGNVQFTKTGISGICVFNMTRHMTIPQGTGLAEGFSNYRIHLNFTCGIGKDELNSLIKGKNNPLFSVLKKPLAEEIMEMAGGDVKKAFDIAGDYCVQPIGVKGWDFAQATKGGVALDEIDLENMESKLIEGLYFSGEILDFDGPCGGFNLQNAWETGIRAGRGIANGL